MGRLGLALSILDMAQLGSPAMSQSYSRLGFSTSIPNWAAAGSSPSTRSFCCTGAASPLASRAILGFVLFATDFSQPASTASPRSYARSRFTAVALGPARFGSMPSSPDFPAFDSVLLLRVMAHAEFFPFAPGVCRSGAFSTTSATCSPGPSSSSRLLIRCGLLLPSTRVTCPDSSLLVLDPFVPGFSSSFQEHTCAGFASPFCGKVSSGSSPSLLGHLQVSAALVPRRLAHADSSSTIPDAGYLGTLPPMRNTVHLGFTLPPPGVALVGPLVTILDAAHLDSIPPLQVPS